MYSGISGLKNFQTKLDVIGNNIANVNTYGFKKGRTIFKDLISQTTAGASGATGTTGGVNAKQVGLGSQLAAIDTLHTGGALQSTGNTLDLGLSGDGFFVVGSLNDDGEFTDLKYTRAGNFYMDSEGKLVDSGGKYVYGVAQGSMEAATDAAGLNDYTGAGYPNLSADPPEVPAGFDNTNPTTGLKVIEIPTTAQSMSVAQDGTVTFVGSDGDLYYAGQLVLAKFSNAGGLEKNGSNYYTSSSNSGLPSYDTAKSSGMASVESGFLEMSNVDLSEEFTDMIVAQRGFQANTRIITTSDSILEELINLKR